MAKGQAPLETSRRRRRGHSDSGRHAPERGSWDWRMHHIIESVETPNAPSTQDRPRRATCGTLANSNFSPIHSNANIRVQKPHVQDAPKAATQGESRLAFPPPMKAHRPPHSSHWTRRALTIKETLRVSGFRQRRSSCHPPRTCACGVQWATVLGSAEPFAWLRTDLRLVAGLSSGDELEPGPETWWHYQKHWTVSAGVRRTKGRRKRCARRGS